MKPKNIAFCLMSIILLLLSNPFVSPAQEIPDVYLTLKNANVIDVKNGKVEKNRTVVIKNDRIVSVSRGSRTKGEVIDLQHRYLVPGLVDSHAHVTNINGSPIERSYQVLDYLLKHGITTIRDAAGNGEILQKVQEEVNYDLKSCADIYYAAFMAGDWYYNRDQHLRKEAYHPWEQLIIPGTNLDSAMKAARACGATGIKLYHSFDGFFLKEVVAAAKRNGLLVWGHAMMYPARPLEVVRSGVQVISHASMLSALIKDPKMDSRRVARGYKDSVGATIDLTTLAKEMKKRNVILDATLSVSEVQERWIFGLVKRLHRMGVKISAGTDKITVLTNPYAHLIDEIGYFVNECGFTPAEALKAATLVSAETIGQEENIGSIKVGKKADLLVIDQNPLEDINRLKSQFLVVKHGRIIKR